MSATPDQTGKASRILIEYVVLSGDEDAMKALTERMYKATADIVGQAGCYAVADCSLYLFPISAEDAAKFVPDPEGQLAAFGAHDVEADPEWNPHAALQQPASPDTLPATPEMNDTGDQAQ